METAIDFIRAIVRPIVTVSLVGAGIAAVFEGILDPEWLAGSATMAAGFWFADRRADSGG